MSTKTITVRTVIAYCIHDDTDYLKSSLDSMASGADSSRVSVFAFVSRLPWHGTPGDWQAAASTAESLGSATVVLGDWPSKQTQRHVAAAQQFAGATAYH